MTTKAVEEFSDPDIRHRRFRAIRRRAIHLTVENVPRWLQQDIAAFSLWSPVMIGVGIGLYFGLKTEPYWLLGVIALLGLAIASVALRKFDQVRMGVNALLLIMIGFIAADLRTEHVAAPVLDRELGISTVTGVVTSVEERNDAFRIVLKLKSISGVASDDLPARARVTWRGDSFSASPGDYVQMRAGLGPPPRPAAPGTFDFARQLFFQEIGAVGFAVSDPRLLTGPPKSFREKTASWVENQRSKLRKRITKAAPNEGGGVVAAIVTGKRDAITERSAAVLRDTGLAHLLAISGLHMGLATGLIFFAVRFFLASIGPLALNFPIKKWAAIAALSSGVFYLVLSGGGWSARRAFITAAIIYTAILFDRRALSLRNVAIAAIIILITTPEALFHPGFQMSFAAVTALIAAYEWASERANPDRSFGWASVSKRYAVGLAVTDTIAALATAPFALFHFNRVALYSLPANVLAMPLMGFWIIPSAVLALLLMPIGLDGWAWRLSAEGVNAILSIASEVAAWPGAVKLTMQWPLSAMLALALGGLWLCLARSPLRLAGLVAIPLAYFIVDGQTKPQIFVAASGHNAAMVTDDGQLIAYSKRRDRFSLSVWRESLGRDDTSMKTMLMSDIDVCDERGCVLAHSDGATVSFINDRAALDEDCARADLVIAFFPASAKEWRSCSAVLIDRRAVWRRGAHAVRIDDQGAIKIQTVGGASGKRPWTGD